MLKPTKSNVIYFRASRIDACNKEGNPIPITGYYNGIYYSIPNPLNQSMIDRFEAALEKGRFVSKTVFYITKDAFNDVNNWILKC